MKVTHTPGPWYYTSGAVWTTPQGPDDGGECIATRASKADIAPWEKDRNMRLAAAAPEMLEALKVLVDQAETNNQMVFGMALEDARAAIRKAEGED